MNDKIDLTGAARRRRLDSIRSGDAGMERRSK